MADDLTIKKGKDWSIELAFTDENNDIIDLTGYQLRMQIREFHDDTNPKLSLTSNPVAGITIDGPAGKATISITNTQSRDLSLSIGVYDIEIVFPAGKVEEVASGRIIVTEEATR